jgi:hypothetical protein
MQMKSGIHQHQCPKCGLNKYCPQITHCKRLDHAICLDCSYPLTATPKKTCQFCYSLYTPPTVPRVPDEACDRCWLEINAAVVKP